MAARWSQVLCYKSIRSIRLKYTTYSYSEMTHVSTKQWKKEPLLYSWWLHASFCESAIQQHKNGKKCFECQSAQLGDCIGATSCPWVHFESSFKWTSSSRKEWKLVWISTVGQQPACPVCFTTMSVIWTYDLPRNLRQSKHCNHSATEKKETTDNTFNLWNPCSTGMVIKVPRLRDPLATRATTEWMPHSVCRWAKTYCHISCPIAALSVIWQVRQEEHFWNSQQHITTDWMPHSVC